MREVIIALGLIEQGDSYLLQLRGLDPQIGGAGLIGCFGGKIENNEHPQDAVCRELKEETNLSPDVDDFELIGEVKVISDHKLEQVKVHGHIFRIVIDSDSVVEAQEGEMARINKNEIIHRLNEMTTGTRAAFEQYILKGEL